MEQKVKWQLQSLAVAVVVFSAHHSAAQLVPIGIQGVRLEVVTEGLNGSLTGNVVNTRAQMIPIDMTPLGDGRQLVLTLSGHVRLLGADGTLAPGAYLDTYNSNSPPIIGTSGGEITDFRQIGNTSIAAHPGFSNPQSRGYGKFYTITSELPDVVPADFDDGTNSVVDSVVTEWTVAPFAVAGATQLTLTGPGANVTQREIMRSARPGIIHTLVDMAFGTDETLYLASGDGGGNAFPNTNGSAFNQDRHTNALDPRNVFGSILRIDPLDLPNDTRPLGGRNNQYRIPTDNYGLNADDPNIHEETFAYGFRSPYRISVDPYDGKIYVGDVGESDREEINVLSNGGNFGWGAYEGTTIERSDLLPRATNAISPLFELYHNLGGQSESTNIVGGFVYRGSAIPQLQGKYVFADTGEENGGQPTNVVDLFYGDPLSTNASSRDDLFRLQIELPDGVSLPDRIWSMSEDQDGELYLLVGPDRLDLFQRSPGETDGGIWKLTAPRFVLNGIAGDVNQDGVVNGNGLGSVESDDITAFISGYGTRGHASAYLQFTHGDMNFDGATNILDWYILARHHQQAAGMNLASLLDHSKVPEPAVPALVLTGLVAAVLNRRPGGPFRAT